MRLATLMRHRVRGVSRAASAAELAWRMEKLGECGVEFLAGGWCLGTPLADEIEVSSGGHVLAGRRKVPPRRADRHLRRGHDDGCRSFGIPLPTVTGLLQAWDSVGAAALVQEGWEAAVAEMRTSPVGWTPNRARDALAYALRQRVTPSSPKR